MKNRKDIFFETLKQNKILLVAGITMVILYYPIGLFHELGHYLVGWGSGSTCVIYWYLAGHCDPVPEQYLLFWALGGIFGMIASFSLLILKKVRANKGILVGVLTLGFSQFVNFFFETFGHSAYLHSEIASMLMAGSIGIVFVGLLRFYSPRSKNKT